VFRGQVLSFGSQVFGHGQTLLQFHRRAELTSAGLVLPAQTLAAVRRQVVEVARHKQQLLAGGQHLKRMLLLYGPPGVGKTHPVRHLTSSLTDTPVIQLTGNALHLVAEACSVARARSSALVAALRGQPARRDCPVQGLVGTPWDRDSPCATAAGEAAPCRDTSRNVVRRQTAAYGAEPNTHSEGSR